jgi:hypothetical protein
VSDVQFRSFDRRYKGSKQAKLNRHTQHFQLQQDVQTGATCPSISSCLKQPKQLDSA